jgi:hypothetical protein
MKGPPTSVYFDGLVNFTIFECIVCLQILKRKHCRVQGYTDLMKNIYGIVNVIITIWARKGAHRTQSASWSCLQSFPTFEPFAEP